MAHPHDAMADELHRLGPLSIHSGHGEMGIGLQGLGVAGFLQYEPYCQWRKSWELNQGRKELLNQPESQIGVNAITKALLEIRNRLNLINTNRVIKREAGNFWPNATHSSHS